MGRMYWLKAVAKYATRTVEINFYLMLVMWLAFIGISSVTLTGALALAGLCIALDFGSWFYIQTRVYGRDF